MDKDKLAKVLALTASDKDGEALAAVRMANKMLAAANLTWAEVLAARSHVRIEVLRDYKAEENWIPPHLCDKVVIPLMFRAVFAQPRTGNVEFWKFMESIHKRWTTHGNLSQAQYTALKRSYQRCTPQSAK